MIQEIIKCPKCGEVIKLSEAITRDIELAIKNKYEKEFELRIKDEREKLKTKAMKEAQEANRLEVTDLKQQLEEKTKHLEKAQQQELDLRRRQREIEEKEKNFELKMRRQLDVERPQIRDKAIREFEESHKLKDLEKDKQLADMKQQIEELKRKAEQGSQKLQGEVLELELEQLLRDEFCFDEFESISSGIKGADILQTVKTQAGRECGKILWESKRTKNWSDGWVQKLKDDQRAAKADLAVIVSEVLPQGFHHFRQIETIWVTDIPSAISLALALRTLLIQVARTKEIQTGKEEKKEIVYNYLTGPEFRNRVQAIMEAFIGMKQDLDTEKRSMEKYWARREKQIEKIILNIAGMHGDLEGITGTPLPTIKMLELPAEEPV